MLHSAKPYQAPRRLLTCLAAGLLLIACQTLSQSQNPSTAESPLSTLAGGEIGRIYYRSANPAHYRNLVDGLANDPPQTVYGDLVIPPEAEEPTPVIIFFHGSSG